MSEKRAHFHSLATARVASPRTRARGSRRVVAAHLCAHEWNSWIRWRCAVDGAARRVRRPNDLVSSPFDRASRVLCERFGSAARRRSFARSDRESRKFEFASADIQVDAARTRRLKASPHRLHEFSTADRPQQHWMGDRRRSHASHRPGSCGGTSNRRGECKRIR